MNVQFEVRCENENCKLAGHVIDRIVGIDESDIDMLIDSYDPEGDGCCKECGIGGILSDPIYYSSTDELVTALRHYNDDNTGIANWATFAAKRLSFILTGIRV